MVLVYYALLGYFIKRLVTDGWEIEEAWKAIYKYPKEKVCDLFEISKCAKIIAVDGESENSSFYIAGYKKYESDENTLTRKSRWGSLHRDDCDFNAVGLIVLEENLYTQE